MMSVQVEDLTEISIFPYYRGVPLEVDPVARAATGRYETGQFAGQTYHSVVVERPSIQRELHVGATYSCKATGSISGKLSTHWLFCTGLGAQLSFGVSRHWAEPACFSPVLPQIDSVLVQLEELSDIVALFPSQTQDGTVSQARLGASGWLVMTRLGCPTRMGILVEDAVLPMTFCEGARGVTLAARSVRTLQSITLEGLDCISAKDTALFLQGTE